MIKLLSFTIVAACLFMGTACTKVVKTVYVQPDSIYTGRIQFVLQYNPGQDSLFYNVLRLGGLADTLSTPGPFTVFVPDNNAMSNGYSPVPSQYLLQGEFLLSQFPIGQTQVLTTSDGYKIFINGYLSGSDTVYTANGSYIHTYDQRASNGVIHVLERTMYSTYYPSCLSFINGNDQLNVFAYAIKRAGLDSLLSDSTQSYTVLAPTNGAMSDAGLSLDAIKNMDPSDVATMVKHYVLPGRNWLYDFVRRFQGNVGYQPDTVEVTTLGGDHLFAIVYGDWLTEPTYYPVSFITSPKTTFPATVDFYNPFDVPTGTGVVHVIDQPLNF